MNIRRRLFIAFAIVLLTSVIANSQTSDKSFSEIRKLYAEINSRISEAAKHEQSDIFIAEVNVNERLNPYPAVGTYVSKTKFYYTYGDRERNPYPDRLVKIMVELKRSSITEYTEIIFSPNNQAIFYLQKVDDTEIVERRFYYDTGKLVAVFDNEVKLAQNSMKTAVYSRKAQKNIARLSAIFRNTIAN